MTALRVAVLSLDRWDEVWRRNQHIASRLVTSGAVNSIRFIEPPTGGFAARPVRRSAMPGIEVLTPPLVFPRRYGGHRALNRWIRRAVAGFDVVWINDPVAGAAVVGRGGRGLYDVTDDWRSMVQRPADRSRIVAAEDVLAERVRTVVCSEVLAERWRSRYGIRPSLIPNGVDIDAITTAEHIELAGGGPHIVYIGTVHPNRVNLDLLARLGGDSTIGTVHLVGPDHLAGEQRARLADVGVRIHGPVPARDVPSWLVSADVLVCPHLVDEFTLSLDAIKAHEYLATSRPIVATATSGFQSLQSPGLSVTASETFVAAVVSAVGTGPFERPQIRSWNDRAEAFARIVTEVGDGTG